MPRSLTRLQETRLNFTLTQQHVDSINSNRFVVVGQLHIAAVEFTACLKIAMEKRITRKGLENKSYLFCKEGQTDMNRRF